MGAALAVAALGACASTSGQSDTGTAGSDRTASTSGGSGTAAASTATPVPGGTSDGSMQGTGTSAGASTPSSAVPPGAPSSTTGSPPASTYGSPPPSAGSTGSSSSDTSSSDTSGSVSGTGSSSDASGPTSDPSWSQRNKLLFNSSERYQVTGRLAAVDDAKGEITIQRENLPPALLRIEEGTRVQIDGRQGAFSDLKPGSDVRASFNLSGRRPIALEVNASSSSR